MEERIPGLRGVESAVLWMGVIFLVPLACEETARLRKGGQKTLKRRRLAFMRYSV